MSFLIGRKHQQGRALRGRGLCLGEAPSSLGYLDTTPEEVGPMTLPAQVLPAGVLSPAGPSGQPPFSLPPPVAPLLGPDP